MSAAKSPGPKPRSSAPKKSTPAKVDRKGLVLKALAKTPRKKGIFKPAAAPKKATLAKGKAKPAKASTAKGRARAVPLKKLSSARKGPITLPKPPAIKLPGPIRLPVQRLKTRLAPGSGIVRVNPRQPRARGGRADALSGTVSAGTTVVDFGGPILPHASVQLIFWGSAWASGTTPSTGGITGAVRTLLASSYMSALAQYRGIGSASFAGAVTVTDSNPPKRFSNDDVVACIRRGFESGGLVQPDTNPSLLYCVIMPPGVVFNRSTTIGEHSYFWFVDFDLPFDLDINKVHFAWVMNDGTLDTVTCVFSHELVESVTDPEGNGVQLNAPGICRADSSNWCEIGDVCFATDVVKGVTAQSYWSQAAGACVVPSGSGSG